MTPRATAQPALMLLTCAHDAEAVAISTALLEKQLIACSKRLPVHALFRWHGAIDSAQETLLLMETAQDLCEEIERTVRSLHSYDTPVLIALPISYMSAEALAWLRESITKQ